MEDNTNAYNCSVNFVLISLYIRKRKLGYNLLIGISSLSIYNILLFMAYPINWKKYLNKFAESKMVINRKLCVVKKNL